MPELNLVFLTASASSFLLLLVLVNSLHSLFFLSLVEPWSLKAVRDEIGVLDVKKKILYLARFSDSVVLAGQFASGRLRLRLVSRLELASRFRIPCNQLFTSMGKGILATLRCHCQAFTILWSSNL